MTGFSRPLLIDELTSETAWGGKGKGKTFHCQWNSGGAENFLVTSTALEGDQKKVWVGKGRKRQLKEMVAAPFTTWSQ